MRGNIRWLGAALMAAAILAFGLAPTAEGQKKKKGEEVTEEQTRDQQAKDIKDLVTAYELAEFGRKNKAPEALITAAGLLRRLAKVKMDTLSEKPTIEVDKDEPAGTKPVDEADKGPDLDKEVRELFDEASGIALALNLNLDPLINQAKTRVLTRAPVGGPKHISRTIGGRQTQVFNIRLHSNQICRFGFHGSIPMHVSVARGDRGYVWADGIVPNGTATMYPGGPGKATTVTIRIRNPSKRPAHFQFFLN